MEVHVLLEGTSDDLFCSVKLVVRQYLSLTKSKEGNLSITDLTEQKNDFIFSCFLFTSHISVGLTSDT